MLQFIKGDNFAEYMQVIQDGTVDISEALFLDTVNHRLYLNGEALDVRINVINEVGENFIENVIRPIFGELHQEDFLRVRQCRRRNRAS